MKKKLLQRMLPLLALLALAAVILNSNNKTPDVVINEVCSSNFSAGCDESGEYSDCIELYNQSSKKVSLNGCFLSDNEKELEKYSLEGIEIAPGGYALIWLNKESGLRISREGEKIFLTDFLQSAYLDQVIVPSLSYDTSYGRIQDGKSEWSVMSTTLGRSNESADLLPTVSLDEPVFEHTSGFYEEAFSLHLYSPSGEKIYYTLDGSEPCADSSVYEKPLWIADTSQEENNYAARKDLAPSKDYTPDFPVDKGVVVRAACYNPFTNQISEVVTETFFIGYDSKPEYEDIAVISLVADPGDLFDSQTGIYGNGAKYDAYLENGGLKDGVVLDNYIDENGETQYRYMSSNAFNEGRQWERKASISYFDETHSHIFTQTTGIRISGNSTRSAAQKSLNLFARNIYDDSEVIPYAFFDHANYYSTIKLRNGGGNTEHIKFLDAFLEDAAQIRGISIQESKPCIVFLNGEYWGIYNIRERYNEEYPALKYGLDAENIMMIKAGNAITSPEETMTAYKYMLDVVTECDLTYDDTYALACELVDIQNLIDYCCINLYLDNRDVAFGYNTALWRTTQEGTPYSDGKWRFMLYDLDECIYPDSNTWEGRENWMAEHPIMMEPVILSLLDNESFRRQFCISFMDIANTAFSYERMHSMLEKWSSLYEAQTVKDHQRFYDPLYSSETFRQEISDIDAFFQERLPFALESLAKTFGLQGELTSVSVSSNIPSGGTLTINTASLEGYSAWEGYYYSDFPVTITAQPNEGYHFVSWQGDVTGTDASINVSLENGAVSLQAIFEKD